MSDHYLGFDPAQGESPDRWREVFPDVEALLAEADAEHGDADEYLVAKVPNVPVFILYGIHEAEHVVSIISIRTHKGSPN